MANEQDGATPTADEIVETPAGVPEETPSAEAPVAEQPTGEAPAPPETPAAPVAAPASPLIDQNAARQVIERNAILERQIADATLNTQVAEYEQQLEAQGYTPDVAQQIAGVQKQAFQAQTQLQDQYRQNIDSERGRFRAAVQIGKEFGVSPEELIDFVDPKAMRTHAGVVKRMATMSSAIASMKKASGPPAQEFEAGAGEPVVISGSGNNLERYNNGANDKAALDAGRQAAEG
jgi:hypothetical protein